MCILHCYIQTKYVCIYNIKYHLFKTFFISDLILSIRWRGRVLVRIGKVVLFLNLGLDRFTELTRNTY